MEAKTNDLQVDSVDSGFGSFVTSSISDAHSHDNSENQLRGNECASLSNRVARLDLKETSNLGDCDPKNETLHLLRKCYLPDDDLDTYLHRYLYLGKIADAKALIDITHDYRLLDIQNKLQQTAMHLCAVLDQGDILQMLLNKGARVDLTDSHGNNIFHIIADCNNFRALEASVTLPPLPSKRYIETIRSAIDAQNYDGLTPFMVAAQKKHDRLCHYLALIGASVNKADSKNGDTAVHEAVRMNEPRLVDFLIRHCNVDVNLANRSGTTPLHYAAGLGNDSIAAILLMNGANKNLSDDEGRKPLDCSRTAKVTELLSN